MVRIAVFGVFTLTLAVTPAAAKEFKVYSETTSFVSDGKHIRVESFLPRGQKNCPAILLVHDSAGLGPIPGTVFRQCSQMLAGKGYVVLLVHYLDATGQTRLTPEEARKSTKHWPTWKNAIRDAVKFAGRHPDVDSSRIGLLGFSLGAYLSLAVASERDLKIAAVAEFFGGLPESLWKDAPNLRLSPTLIIHGLKDQIVPVTEAQALRDLFVGRKIPCEYKVYDCDHLFSGTQLRWKKAGTTGNMLDIDGDIGDARDLTIRFFAAYLMGAGQGLERVRRPE